MRDSLPFADETCSGVMSELSLSAAARVILMCVIVSVLQVLGTKCASVVTNSQLLASHSVVSSGLRRVETDNGFITMKKCPTDSFSPALSQHTYIPTHEHTNNIIYLNMSK